MADNILATPIKINGLTLANRMVMGPMAANAPRPEGAPSEQTIAFFEARARGGIGMIIVGGVFATPRSIEEAPIKAGLRLDTDEFIPEFRPMVDAVHAYGVPIIAEIMPGFGRMGVPGTGRQIISASPKNVVIPQESFPKGFHVPGGRATTVPQEATIAEIQVYEQEMIAAAGRAVQAGFDGIEVAAHMSYFASSFLSPRTNWRTDEYGGSVENRARMLVNIVAGIRKLVPADFVVGLRITANDYMPDGQGVEGYAAVAKQVEAAGVDYVALSAGCYETMSNSAPAIDGGLVDNGDARLFKQTLSVPILIQGIHDPARAAQALADGNGDLVMLARPTLADPEYARKVVEGRPETIVKCVRDNYCMRRMIFNMPIRCEVNPAMGRESRGPGSLPPLKRLVQVPVEQAILKLTGSERVMSLAGSFVKKAQ